MRIIAIDPIGCGCTECLIGQYVPLDQATDRQIAMLVLGKLRNNTSTPIAVNIVSCVQAADDGTSKVEFANVTASVQLSWDGYTKDWDLGSYLEVTGDAVLTEIVHCVNCDKKALPGSNWCSWTCHNEDDRHDRDDDRE